MHKTIMLALSAALLAAVASCSGVRAPAPDYQAKGPIEQSFQMRGPWQVTRTNSGAACTSSGLTCEIWMPDTAGPRPVIAWANGTGQMPEVYAEFLDHLASWGFVVIAPRDSATGNGQTVQEAAEYIIRQGETPASPYHGRINPARMAALGHSQGATSVTALHIRNTPIFRPLVLRYRSGKLYRGRVPRLYLSLDQRAGFRSPRLV